MIERQFGYENPLVTKAREKVASGEWTKDYAEGWLENALYDEWRDDGGEREERE